MLHDGRVATTLPAQDLDRARRFYAEKLGLEPSEERAALPLRERRVRALRLRGRTAWASASRSPETRSRSLRNVLRNLRGARALGPVMQPVSRTRWRALPTALIVIGAIALGAATARADAAPAQPAAASTSAAIR